MYVFHSALKEGHLYTGRRKKFFEEENFKKKTIGIITFLKTTEEADGKGFSIVQEGYLLKRKT